MDREVDVNELYEADGIRKAALHLAAKLGHLEILQELIKYGANIEVQTSHADWRPVHEAVEYSQFNIIKALVNRHEDTNVAYPRGMTLIYKALFRERIDIAKFLQQHGAAVDPVCATNCLPRAVARPNLGVIELLVDHGADINDPDKQPLCMATRCERIDNVRLLVKCGAKVNIKDPSGYVPAQIAASRGWLEGLKFFMNEGRVKRNLDWLSAAFELCSPGWGSGDKRSASTIKYLSDRGFIDVDSQDSKGATLLYTAWQLGWQKTVRMLLEKTSNPICRSRTGETTWDIALMAGQAKPLSWITDFAVECSRGPRKKKFSATCLSSCSDRRRILHRKDLDKDSLLSDHARNADNHHNYWSWLNIHATEVKSNFHDKNVWTDTT